ncbi:hypothetical protein HK104_009799 [Borealophlyctis nickersoniae]|nr:hypothetical protein HK104_009799 [Borealophlyctis nickersoniae]
MSADGRHYQKKVKTSEEAQQARKEKEKRKIDEYRALSDKLSEKRRNREFDDEALGLTTSIVSLNPEFYTAWNFRREILLETFKSLDEDERQKRCLSELKLVEDALRLNPKSYWVWNHRRWTLQTMPRPDWNKEFKLLSMMLDLDARNFHGWDYRRYVIAQTSNRTPKEEFEYTSAKINQNFSNYSAWHHRSKVLAEAFPDDQERDRVIQNDFEIVRNAVYTEPADQSAWLYQRWLLGKKKEPLEVRKAYIMKLENTRYLLVVCFNQSVKAFGSDAIAIKIGNRIIKEMRPVIDTSLAFCPVQRLEILEEIELHDGGSSEVAVAILKDGVVGLNGIRLGKDWQGTVSLGTGMLPGTCLEVSFQLTAEVDSPTTSSGGSLSYQPDSVWRRELQSIQELVEIEPDSKWALLTLVHIMNELGGHDAKAIGILEKLENLDSYRANYYRDLSEL